MNKKRDKITQADSELFRRTVKGAKPIENDRIEPCETPAGKTPAPTMAYPPPEDSGFAVSDHASDVGSDDHLFYSKGGLQDKKLRKLQRGQIAFSAHLDLHGKSIEQAGTALTKFLQRQQCNRSNCVLVIHGRGYRSAEQKPILKRYVNQWLRQHDAVLAFCSAQPGDGGPGAVYVMLKRR